MILRRTKIQFTQHGPPDVIGFWMTIDGVDPANAQVRIIVTASALERIDSSQPRGFAADAKIFEEHRDLIEAVASDKFETGRVENETHEGRPAVRVSADDL